MHGRLEGESWQGRQLTRRSYVVCPPSQEVLIGVRLPGHVFHFIIYCSGFIFSVPYRVVIGGTLGLDKTACFLGGISCPASLLLIQTESIQYVPLLHTRIIIIKSFQSCMCNTLGFICITHHMYFLHHHLWQKHKAWSRAIVVIYRLGVNLTIGSFTFKN